jgi:hypothetical protein
MMAAIVTSIGKIYSIDTGSAANEDPSDAEARLAQSVPSVRSIGQDLTARMEQWLRAGRGRRLDNLRGHVQQAMEISGREAVEAVSETPAFGEWAEGVSNIDVRDPALVDAWQAALIGLQKGGAQRMRPMKVAQRMLPDDAAAFARLIRKKGIDTAEIARLKELGLVRTAFDRMFNRVAVFLYLLTFSLASLAATIALVSPQVAPELAAAWNEIRMAVLTQIGLALPAPVLVFVIGSVCTVIPMLLQLFVDATPLTRDGQAMASLMLKVDAAVKAGPVDRPVPAQAGVTPKLALAV